MNIFFAVELSITTISWVKSEAGGRVLYSITPIVHLLTEAKVTVSSLFVAWRIYLASSFVPDTTRAKRITLSELGIHSSVLIGEVLILFICAVIRPAHTYHV